MTAIERGKYIVIEGSDEFDKATQAQMLVARLTEHGIASHYVHEPWELPSQYPRLSHSALTELLRLTAYRVDLFNNEIEPGLAAGEIVVADGNWLSSVARQGIARELGVATVRELTRAHLPGAYLNPRFLALISTPNRLQTSTPDDSMQKIRQAYDTLGSTVSLRQKENGSFVQTFSYISAAGSDTDIHTRIVEKLVDTHAIPKI